MSQTTTPFYSLVSLLLICALLFPSFAYAVEGGPGPTGNSSGFSGDPDQAGSPDNGGPTGGGGAGGGSGAPSAGGGASGESDPDGDHSTGFEGSPEIGGSRDADSDGTPDAEEGQNAADMADRAAAAGFEVDKTATINGQIGGSLGSNQVSIDGKSYDIGAVEKAGAAIKDSPFPDIVDKQATLDKYQEAETRTTKDDNALCSGCVVSEHGFVGSPTEVASAEIDYAIGKDVGTRSAANNPVSNTDWESFAQMYEQSKKAPAFNLTQALSPITAANWNAQQAPLTGGLQPSARALDPTPLSQDAVSQTQKGTAGDIAGEAAYAQAQPEVAGVFSTFSTNDTEVTVTVMSDGSVTGRSTTRDPGGFQHSVSLSEAEISQALGHVPTALDSLDNRGLTAINSSNPFGVNLGVTQIGFAPALTNEQIANLSIFSPQNIPEQNLTIDKTSMTGTTITASPAGGTFASNHASEELDRIAEINKTNPAAAGQLADAYTKAVDASFKSDHITNTEDKTAAVALNELAQGAVRDAIKSIEQGGFLTGASGQLAIDEPFNRDIARAEEAAKSALAFADNAAKASSLQEQKNDVVNKSGAEARTLDAEIQAANLAKSAAYADTVAALSQAREAAVRANTLDAMADIAAKHAEMARSELNEALSVTGLEAQTRALDDAAQNIARNAAATVEAIRDAAVQGNLSLRDTSAQVSVTGNLTTPRSEIVAREDFIREPISTVTIIPTPLGIPLFSYNPQGNTLPTSAAISWAFNDTLRDLGVPAPVADLTENLYDVVYSDLLAEPAVHAWNAAVYGLASLNSTADDEANAVMADLAKQSAINFGVSLALEVAGGVALGVAARNMTQMGIGNLGREVDNVANDYIGQSTELPDYPAYNPNVGSQMSEFAVDVKTNFDPQTGNFGTPEVSIQSIAANDNAPSLADGAAAARDLGVAANDASSAMTAAKNAADDVAPESVDPVFERSLTEIDTRLSDAINQNPSDLTSPQVQSKFSDINKALDSANDLASNPAAGKVDPELQRALDNLENEISDFAEQSARVAALNESPAVGAAAARDTANVTSLQSAANDAVRAVDEVQTAIDAVDPPLQRALDQIETARREFQAEADIAAARELEQLLKEMDDALGRAAESHVAAAEAAAKVDNSIADVSRMVENVRQAADEDAFDAAVRDMEQDLARAVDEQIRLSEINETLDDSVTQLTRTLDDMKRAADEDSAAQAVLDSIEPNVAKAIDESVAVSQALKNTSESITAVKTATDKLAAEAQTSRAIASRQTSNTSTGGTRSIASRALNGVVAASIIVGSMFPVGPTIRAIDNVFDIPNPVARIVDEAIDIPGSKVSNTNASLFGTGQRTFSTNEIAITGRMIAGEAKAPVLSKFVGAFSANGSNVVAALDTLTLSEKQAIAGPMNVGNNRLDPANPDKNTLDKVYKSGQDDGIKNNGQFSTFNENKVRADDAKYAKDKAAYDALAKAYVDGTVSGRYGTEAAVPVPNATHYVADYINQPSWTNNLNRVAHVGDHYFYTIEGTNFKIGEIDQVILSSGSNHIASAIPTLRPENVSTAGTRSTYTPGFFVIKNLRDIDVAEGAKINTALPTSDITSADSVVLRNQNAIRDWAITGNLKSQIEHGLDLIKDRHGEDVRFVVTSGGQPAIGKRGVDRTGGHRHDNGNAGDGYLQNVKTGHIYDFTDVNDLPIFETFIEGTTQAGANGVGADIDYMGPNTIHVGGGSVTNWGAGLVKKNGKWVKVTSSKFSPQWLKASQETGLKQRSDFDLAEYKANRTEINNEQIASTKQPAPPKTNDQGVVSQQNKDKANGLIAGIRADLNKTAPTPKTLTQQITEGANKGLVSGVGWVAEKLSQAATAVENARTSLNQWAGRQPAPEPRTEVGTGQYYDGALKGLPELGVKQRYTGGYGITATQNAKPFVGVVTHHSAGTIEAVIKEIETQRTGANGEVGYFGYHVLIGKDENGVVQILQLAPENVRTNHIGDAEQGSVKSNLDNSNAIGVAIALPAKSQAQFNADTALTSKYGTGLEGYDKYISDLANNTDPAVLDAYVKTTRTILDNYNIKASADTVQSHEKGPSEGVALRNAVLDSYKDESVAASKVPAVVEKTPEQTAVQADTNANQANVVNVVFAPTFDSLSITTATLGKALPQNAKTKTLYVGNGQNLANVLAILAALPPGTQVNLIGWSKGAIAALYIANQLNGLGMPVANLLMIDPGQGTVGLALAELPSIDLVTGKIGIPDNVQNVKVYKPKGGGAFQKQFVEPNILENALLGTSDRQPNGFKGLDSADIIEVNAGPALGPRGVGLAHMGIGYQDSVIGTIAEAVKNSQTRTIATEQVAQSQPAPVTFDATSLSAMLTTLKKNDARVTLDGVTYAGKTGTENSYEFGLTDEKGTYTNFVRGEFSLATKEVGGSVTEFSFSPVKPDGVLTVGLGQKLNSTNPADFTTISGNMTVIGKVSGGKIGSLEFRPKDGQQITLKGKHPVFGTEVTRTTDKSIILNANKTVTASLGEDVNTVLAWYSARTPELVGKIADELSIINKQVRADGNIPENVAAITQNEQVANVANPKTVVTATAESANNSLDNLRGQIGTRVSEIEAELGRADLTPEALNKLTNELTNTKASSALLVDAKTKADAGDFAGAQALLDQAKAIFDARNNTGGLLASLDNWDLALLGGIGLGIASLLSKLIGTLRTGGGFNPFARLSSMRSGARTQSQEGGGTGDGTAGVRTTAVNDNYGPNVRPDDSNLNFKARYGKGLGSRLENVGIAVGILSALAFLLKSLLKDDEGAGDVAVGGSSEEGAAPETEDSKSLWDKIKDFFKGGGGLPEQENSNTATSTIAAKGVVTVKVARDLNSDQFDLQVTDVYSSAEYADSLVIAEEEETEYLEDDQPSIIFNEYNEVIYSDGTFAPVTVDGIQIDESGFEYLYVVEYYDNGEPVTIEANEERLPENFFADIASYFFTSNDSFTIGDVAFITRAFYDPKPDVPRDELYEYTIVLNDASVRKVVVPEFTSYAFLSARFAEVGYQGDVLLLVAEAQDTVRTNDSNLLSETIKTITSGFVSMSELLGFGPETEESTTDLNALTPTNDGVVNMNDIRKATVFFGIEAECPDTAELNQPYLYEIVIAKEALPNAYSDLSFRALRCGTGDKLTYVNEIASHLESLAGFGTIDRDLLYGMLRFGDLSGIVFNEEPETNTAEEVATEDEAVDEETPKLIPNTTNEVAFEVKAVDNSGNVLTDWVYGDLEISSGVQLYFRWNGEGYTQCLPFLNDNGLYSLTRVNDPSLNTGNTEAEGYNIREGNLAYRIECGGQDNGETGVDMREINVVVGN